MRMAWGAMCTTISVKEDGKLRWVPWHGVLRDAASRWIRLSCDAFGLVGAVVLAQSKHDHSEESRPQGDRDVAGLARGHTSMWKHLGQQDALRVRATQQWQPNRHAPATAGSCLHKPHAWRDPQAHALLSSEDLNRLAGTHSSTASLLQQHWHIQLYCAQTQASRMHALLLSHTRTLSFQHLQLAVSTTQASLGHHDPAR